MIEFFKLDQAVLLSVSGKHAERYLQARLSNDIRSASQSQAIRAAALSAQGKCEALFLVWRDKAGNFLLLADGADAGFVLDRLLAFRVTEQVVVENLSELYNSVYALDASSAEAVELFGEVGPAYSVAISGDCYLLKHARVGSLGVDLLCKKDTQNSLYTKIVSGVGTAVSSSSFHTKRMRAKQAMFPFDINGEHLLLEAGLSEAISFTKGCYVGQEVIARIDSQGRPPRKLNFFEVLAEQMLEAGQSVFLAEDLERRRAVGQIAFVCKDSDTDKIYCSAYIKNSPDVLGKNLCAASARLVPL